jgi:CheY-like chemotaxis protein
MSERRLLLADDSVTVQKVVQLTFAEEGIEVSIAGDGDSAMLNFAEFKPDIVLADVNMPGLSGYEVCERIKQDNGDIPVVLLVGSFEKFDEDEARRVGADGSMTKPFQSIRQLIDTVSTLLTPDIPAAFSTPEQDRAGGHDGPDLSETIEIPFYRDAAKLGDRGMDDEMIETTRMDDIGGSEPEDEPAPETDYESAAEADDEPAPEPETHSFENGEENPDQNFERVIDEPEQEEPVELFPEISQPIAAPVMELDDLNFLEIPVAGVPVLPPVEYETHETHGASEDTGDSSEPSTEFVETVVQRVVEKLSGESLREVVRDVVREIHSERSGD